MVLLITAILMKLNSTRLILILVLTILLSCNGKYDRENTKDKSVKADTLQSATQPVSTSKTNTPDTDIIETFTDSLNLGDKGKCKVELIKHRVYDDSFIIVKFYVRDQGRWCIKNIYAYETNAMMGFTPVISDYNNDNFNDITFISGNAARGANEVRRLFIYNDQKQELISIVNSQDYPNMLYNNELQCIDAFLVYGGCSTVFLHIKGDSLKEFASVELMDGLTVTTYDNNGKAKIIRHDKSYEETFTRYKNFNTLQENDKY